MASERFHTAATTLKDCLVHMGFEEQEAKAAVQGEGGESLFDAPAPFRLTLEEAPALGEVEERERLGVRVVELPGGQVEVEVDGWVSSGLEGAMLARVPETERVRIAERVKEHNRAWARSPAERGVRFAVPRLTIEDERGERLPFDRDSLREIAGFDLREYPADLRGLDYNATTQRYTLDVVGERLELSLMGLEEVGWNFGGSTETEVGLTAWLDPKLRDMSLDQRVLSAWILSAIRGLLERPGMTMGVLDRGRFILLRKLQESIAAAKMEEDKRAYQEALFGRGSTALTLMDDAFSFRFGQEYTPAYECTGTRFQKHYYRKVGEMQGRGEEYACAAALDQDPEVKHWVRNLAGRGREKTSFWLQTATDRFYPDFVAELMDGTILAVEYKGEGYKTNDDSKEKDALGRLWAMRSGGRARFLMAVKDAGGRDVREQIGRAVRGA